MTAPSFTSCDVEIFDLRALQTDPAPHTRVRHGKTVQRDPSMVVGITLHQTACHFGVAKYQAMAAGGDKEAAQRRRALNIAAHAVAFREGWVVLPHKLTSYVYHANGLNGPTLGFEVEGIYAGLEDDPDTAPREDRLTTWGPRPPDKVDERTVVTARMGLLKLVSEGAREGMDLRYLYGHRQSSATRRADPGEGLWKAIVPWAEQQLGLKADLTRTLDNGRPIPRAWSGIGHDPY